MRKLFAVLLTCTLILILLSGVEELPRFGMENNPANNEVMRHYIDKAAEETGAMNIVTGIILDYRAFDTFVEASVLFAAAMVVLLILKRERQEQKDIDKGSPNKSVILREITRVIYPFIQIFGVYIILFGHLSPGGGFSGGTIIGASFMLYYVVYGSGCAKEKFSYAKLVRFLSGGMILYGLLKGYSFITGGSGLHLPQPEIGTPGNIISGGLLLPLNILIGIIVSITMYFFFTLFDRGEV